MNLAFALFTYSSHSGLSRDAVAIARACGEGGHRVRVYAGEIRDGGLRAAGLDAQLVAPPFGARSNYRKNRAFAARLPGAAAEFSPDLIVGFNKMPGLDVYYAADAAFAVKRGERGFLYRMTPRCRQHFAFEKAVFGRESETEILMISRAQIAVHQHFYGTPAARMTLLPPGISREHIIGAGEDAAARRAAFRAELGIADTDKALLALGSGFRIKGLERTLRGLAALPPALAARTHLWVVGEDNAAPFERLARKLGVGARVRFFGGRDDAPEFLLGADVLAHPAHLETAGKAILEAMVSGLPALVSDACGYANYVREADMGEVIASPFSQEAFNLKLRELLESEREVWRARGREFARGADIYDMPLHARRRIEEIGKRARQS
ncbi:MAG: glycosyltransferase family 4 protein [Gammaproteobacteria bacterium]|nr:glycosyltransferase family 4 protein [Gammaproteobacteria bacterium]